MVEIWCMSGWMHSCHLLRSIRSANLLESKDVARAAKFPPRSTHLPRRDTRNATASCTIRLNSCSVGVVACFIFGHIFWHKNGGTSHGRCYGLRRTAAEERLLAEDVGCWGMTVVRTRIFWCTFICSIRYGLFHTDNLKVRVLSYFCFNNLILLIIPILKFLPYNFHSFCCESQHPVRESWNWRPHQYYREHMA